MLKLVKALVVKLVDTKDLKKIWVLQRKLWK